MRKITFLLLAAVIGCGTNPDPKIAELESQLAKAQQENDELKTELKQAQQSLIAIQEQFEEVKKAESNRASRAVEYAQAMKEKADADLELKKAEERLALELKKKQAAEAQFGALSNSEQDEVKAFSERVRQGEELNNRELDRLESLAGLLTGEYITKQRIINGRRDGIEKIAKSFNASKDIPSEDIDQFAVHFSRLNKAEQIELLRLSEKVESGKSLNKIELERALQLGRPFTRDFVVQQQEKTGQEAGAKETLDAFK